jgi:hypothetical protein
LAQYYGTAVVNSANTMVLGAVQKGVTSYAPSTAKACLNAGAVASGAMTGGYAALVANGVRFFSDEFGTSMTSGYLRSVRYWPRVLSDAEMQAVTS